jgi:hypothetical protein
LAFDSLGIIKSLTMMAKDTTDAAWKRKQKKIKEEKVESKRLHGVKAPDQRGCQGAEE